MIAVRSSDLAADEIRAILGPEAFGMSDDDLIELNEQMAAMARLVCDAALDDARAAGPSSGRGERS